MRDGHRNDRLQLVGCSFIGQELVDRAMETDKAGGFVTAGQKIFEPLS
jgi:hypothetical protein